MDVKKSLKRVSLSDLLQAGVQQIRGITMQRYKANTGVTTTLTAKCGYY